MGVGGKEEVIRRFEERIGQLNEREEFYLVDGDFDELLNREVPSDRAFFSLSRYDIESFLLA
jgi:DNA-binding Lrp family transcriptional regulator